MWGKWPQAATCNQLTDCASSAQQDRKPSSGSAPVGLSSQAGEQACWLGVGDSGGDFRGLVILRMRSWGCVFRTAGSHLPSVQKISGITGTKLKVRFSLLSVSGKRSPPELTWSLRMTNCVTVHKLFHLLPRHQGLINHRKLSRDYTMLNTNRGDPWIHRVVTRGLEYSCSATPVHSLTQQRLFVLPGSGGPLLLVRWKGTCTWCVAAILMPCFVLLGRYRQAQWQMPGNPATPDSHFHPPNFFPLSLPDLNSSGIQDLLKWTHTSRESSDTEQSFWWGVSFSPPLAVGFCTDSFSSLTLSFQWVMLAPTP